MRLVVKIGTSSLTDQAGVIDGAVIDSLCDQVDELRSSGHEIVVVTSGAVAAGVAAMGLGSRPTDMATLLPLVNPHLISVPTMLIHGEYDDVADTEGLWPFFRDLPNPEKKYVIIPGAGHMIQFQLGHRFFQKEVVQFFKPAE